MLSVPAAALAVLVGFALANATVTTPQSATTARAAALRLQPRDMLPPDLWVRTCRHRGVLTCGNVTRNLPECASRAGRTLRPGRRGGRRSAHDKGRLEPLGARRRGRALRPPQEQLGRAAAHLQ